MKKILIKTYGFIGDILFASSLAKKFKEQEVCVVDYCIGFPQPYKLLKNNPHIDNVYLSQRKGPQVTLPSNIDESKYDLIYTLPECRQDTPPTIHYQRSCGIHNPSPEYEVYTDKDIDDAVKYEFELLNTRKVPTIGFVANWKQSTILYTEQDYVNGSFKVPEIMSHQQKNTRNVDHILRELNKTCMLVPLGYDSSVTQYDSSCDATSTYTNTASLIKMCDLVIGQEGGMTNLAAGVGVRCIITTDFMHALYGPNGMMRRFNEVMLGPKNLFPDGDHIHISPYATDEEIIKLIQNEL